LRFTFTSMKTKFLLIAIATSTLTLSGFLIIEKESPDEFLKHRAEFVMREIGHRILLHSGDSTSRVLPVRKITGRTFQLEFQNEFTFVPDTLMNIVQNSLAAKKIPLPYTVSVLDCRSGEMIYGYEMISVEPKEIACLGRIQPKGCYRVQIVFLEVENKISAPQYVAGAAFVTIAFIGFIFFGLKGKKIIEATTNQIPISDYFFCEEKRTLRKGNTVTSLTHKEARVLSVLAANVNQIVERDQLIKDVWGREGVIVGRSLDVFISKLRKKFDASPDVRIVNIHGNGYKLEID
jgi:hypothetical protein